MNIFEVSKHIVGVVFHDRTLHVHAIIVRQLGTSGFEGIAPEVVFSLVSLLKWVSYDLLFLLDAFRDLWYNLTKCFGVRYFLAKWFEPPHL
jgi:hypothetical protein